nr:MAG TPA: hypothetical protein [Crassvirales sp.]
MILEIVIRHIQLLLWVLCVKLPIILQRVTRQLL